MARRSCSVRTALYSPRPEPEPDATRAEEEEEEDDEELPADGKGNVNGEDVNDNELVDDDVDDDELVDDDMGRAGAFFSDCPGRKYCSPLPPPLRWVHNVTCGVWTSLSSGTALPTSVSVLGEALPTSGDGCSATA